MSKITGILFGDDDVITYAVVDQDNYLCVEYFAKHDAEKFIIAEDKITDDDLRIVELCNGQEME